MAVGPCPKAWVLGTDLSSYSQHFRDRSLTLFSTVAADRLVGNAVDSSLQGTLRYTRCAAAFVCGCVFGVYLELHCGSPIVRLLLLAFRGLRGTRALVSTLKRQRMGVTSLPEG